VSVHGDDARRCLIPRWRYINPLETAAESVGDRRAAREFSINEAFWHEKVADWREQPCPGTAADLIACAIMLQRCTQVPDAIEYLNERVALLRPAAAELARHAHRAVHPEKCNASTAHSPAAGPAQPIGGGIEARVVIAQSRSRLREDPRDAFAWLDMSRSYTVLGDRRRATEAMTRSLQLAGNNRLVLRAACRRLVHVGAPDEAHSLLMHHPRTRHDPWLLAAEIATSEIIDEPSRLVRDAKSLIDSRRFLASATTELSGALGMLEYRHGSAKRARRLIRESLVSPTDNTVAQARWIAARMTGIEISESAWDTPHSYEAWCWRAYQVGQWDEAFSYAKQWVRDEPFSSRAAVHATFIAESIFNDHDYAIACAQQVLQADPNDSTLLNNLVVALLNSGRIEEARTIFEHMERSIPAGTDQYVYTATAGLMKYRTGEPAAGYALYKKALNLAAPGHKLRVISHWLKEEMPTRTADQNEVLAKLKALARTQGDLVSLRLLENIPIDESKQLHREALRIIEESARLGEIEK